MKKIFCLFLLAAAILCACRSITNAVPKTAIGNKTVILSFDDGPNADGDTTARLLDVLQKYNIRAMFALLGENVEKNPDLVRRIYDEGHTIMNHGYSDKWAINMNDEEFKTNLRKGESAIAAALGEYPHPKLYRPHGGFYTRRQETIWRAEGWELAGCNIRAYDAAATEAGKQKVIRTIIKKTEKTHRTARAAAIILLHDAKDTHPRMEQELAKTPKSSYNRTWIPDAAEEIIITLRAKGYRFSP
jgi:peptidoglycan/xylan/chitin deacetylase (PgdA/CDA1 family)